jgi:sigma-E factor negative regulatory protein RseA
MVMNENISRLMDGEIDPEEFERICGEMRSPNAVETWVCYHVIGDQMRGARFISTCLASRFTTQFCAALADEPTVLAPAARRDREGKVATAAWAVAATLAAVTVVGWTAFSMADAPPTAVAKAREAATVRAAQILPPGNVPADYLIAHEEYSPSTVAQGAGPYLRAAVAVTGTEPRP